MLESQKKKKVTFYYWEDTLSKVTSPGGGRAGVDHCTTLPHCYKDLGAGSAAWSGLWVLSPPFPCLWKNKPRGNFLLLRACVLLVGLSSQVIHFIYSQQPPLSKS